MRNALRRGPGGVASPSIVRAPAWAPLLAGLAACAGAPAPPAAVATTSRALTAPEADVARATPATSDPTAAPEAAKPDPRAVFAAWLTARLPAGGEIVDEAPAPIRVVHAAKKGDTWLAIARAYLDLTDVYMEQDLARALQKDNGQKDGKQAGPAPGARVEITHLVTGPFKSADDERLGLPPDRALRGIYVRGSLASIGMYTQVLDEMQKRGMNMIVLDAKDYDGPLTYASKVPIAVESGATKGALIRDFARAIRFAHARGVRVSVRIACFEDEIVAKFRKDLSVQAKWGGAYPIGWLDPNNEGAQQYAIDLANEAMDMGADEINLDYVRYPVLGVKGADFKLQEKKLTKVDVITGFVKKVHAVTQARKVALSLDVFGVIAEGKRVDIDALGQDPPLLAPHAEALCPMVYPSHYTAGYYGFEIPGNHPEIVGMGTKKIIDLIDKAGVKGGAAVRPWVQAMPHKSPEFGPQYLATELKSATDNGALGWLMWNPGQGYGVAWAAVRPR
jgi:hypothetical protein